MSDYKNTEEATPEGNFKIRFIIFLSIFAVFAIVVLFGYARLMTGPESARTRSSPPIQERGPILDRNGRILAMQTRLANISIWKPVVEDLNSLLQILSPVLGISTEELNTRINTSRSDFIYAAKRVDQSIFTEVERLRKEGRLRGVGVEYISARIYPEQRLASYVTGFVGDDNTGLEGVELTMNSLLAPSQNMPYGHQVFLTIDANVQYKLESIARTTMQENKAEAVLMIAMRPDTGEILGYVSMPDFDPNEFRSTPAEQRINRAAVYRYEPGSVFKIFSIASIMELGGINEYSTFRCNGRYENITPGGERVVINCLGAHGIVSPREIITYSCNSGAAYAADTVSNEAFDSKIRDLGFGSRTNAGFSGESPGDIAPLNAWSLRTKQTIAIGQELSVTALQILKAATAIANDGLLVQPHIVSAVVASDGSLVQDYRQEAPKRVLSAETAAAMRSFMESAASEAGTGRRAGLDDIPLAVKTGTAQVWDSEKKKYSETNFIASCIAMLPAEKPELIIYHVVMNPQGDSFLGGRIAAPPVREAADQLSNYLGIVRGRNTVITHSGTVVIPAEQALQIGDTMPNLIGYAKRQLLPLLAREDINITIRGEGWVNTQSPEPGTKIEHGTQIYLELK